MWESISWTQESNLAKVKRNDITEVYESMFLSPFLSSSWFFSPSDHLPLCFACSTHLQLCVAVHIIVIRHVGFTHYCQDPSGTTLVFDLISTLLYILVLDSLGLDILTIRHFGIRNDSVLPRSRNMEHTLIIFSGIWPTVTRDLTTATVKGYLLFPGSLLQGSCFPIAVSRLGTRGTHEPLPQCWMFL